MLKSLVIYDSNFGNTQIIAETIAKGLAAQAVKISKLDPQKVHDYDLIVIGTPIIGWQPTVNLRAFLNQLPDLTGIKAATFDTRVKLFYSRRCYGQSGQQLTGAGSQNYH